jgi:hypothetical protein
LHLKGIIALTPKALIKQRNRDRYTEREKERVIMRMAEVETDRQICRDKIWREIES